MKITKVGFGYTKKLGNYENCKVYLEAQLEDWENPEESMAELRNRVSQELDLPDRWHDLKHKFAKQLAALTSVSKRIEKAEKQWETYACFLAAHGVDPATLAVITSDDYPDDDEDDDFDPYYGDEYDRLHDGVIEDYEETHHEF